MKILAFGASNSKDSINQNLAHYAARKISKGRYNIEMVELSNYEPEIYSIDREIKHGIPSEAKDLLNKIEESDIVVISFAEHNGSYTAVYKNIFDWMSRINPKVFNNKKLVYLSTSPGEYGAASVLAAAVGSVSYFGGELIGSLSVPNFQENFSVKKEEIINPNLNDKLEEIIKGL
tara:strand:- start:2517 stop:3044 length:528 start_codon:yes stop_codon:yes gene_type:complete